MAAGRRVTWHGTAQHSTVQCGHSSGAGYGRSLHERKCERRDQKLRRGDEREERRGEGESLPQYGAVERG